MFRLLIDHNFDHRIVRGLRLRMPRLDMVFTNDVGLATAEDPELLAWSANQGRVVVTHGARTVPAFAYDRLAAGKRMPGVILVRTSVPIGRAIEDILMILNCCRENELDGQVYDVPI